MHSSLHKVYIPQTAKDNQYLLAELHVSEALLAQYADQANCYKELGQLFFTLCQQAGLRHVSFIANDKLPVVRYHTEAFSFQTQDQILFFYNPRYHEAQQSFIDDTGEQLQGITRLLNRVAAQTGETAAKVDRSPTQSFDQRPNVLLLRASSCCIMGRS